MVAERAADAEDNGESMCVRVASTRHRVRVVAEARPDIEVDGTARVLTEGSCTTIDHVHASLVIRVPVGTDIVVGTTSGRVEIEGAVGRTAVITNSGRVSVEDAESVDIRTGSARVEVGRTAEECCIHTSSGRVEVGGCGSADVTTASGRITLQDVHGPVRAHCVSGRVEVGLAAPDDVDAETVSGRISVTVPSDVTIQRNEDDSVVASWPGGAESSVNVRSVSGRVDVSPR